MDSYRTIKTLAEGTYSEKRSKFLAFAMPVSSVDEVKLMVADYQKKYYDARHVCYAYMLGAERLEFRANDNGEPSGTAGKPILGQINSFGLTNVVVVVVRYFGGIKLGTSGLIVAYREAARLAIEAGEILECHEQATCAFTFPYLSMNDVMQLTKREQVTVLEQEFNNVCSMTLQTDADKLPALVKRLNDIDGVTMRDTP